MPNYLEGYLHTEVDGTWCETFCSIRGSQFQLFEKQMSNMAVSSNSESFFTLLFI